MNYSKEKLIKLINSYHNAMVHSSINLLNDIVDENFSLEHITGYIQPKEEWFNVIDSKQFNYHEINIDEKTLLIDIFKFKAIIHGKGIFNATINSFHNNWKLQFTLNCIYSNNEWIISKADYKTF